MQIKQVVAEAWQLTQENPKLKWFAFFPSIVWVLFNLGWVAYQYYSLSGVFHYETILSFDDIKNYAFGFYETGGSMFWVVIAATIIVIVSYLLLPSFFQAGLIGMIDDHEKGERVSLSKGMSHGFLNYLPVFEYHSMISPFSVFFIVSISLWILKVDVSMFYTFLYICIVLVPIFLVIGFLLGFADYFIVLKKEGVINSMSMSSRLVLLHLKENLLMTILMLIISGRILVNLLIVLLIPVAIIYGFVWFSSFGFGLPLMILSVVVAVALLILTAWFNSVMMIFTTAVWELTYLKLLQESEDKLK